MYRNDIRAPAGALADACPDDEGVAVGAVVSFGATTPASEITTERPEGAPAFDAQPHPEVSALPPTTSASYDLDPGNTVGLCNDVQTDSEKPLFVAQSDQEDTDGPLNRDASAREMSDPCVLDRPLSWYRNEIHSAKVREVEVEKDPCCRAELILHRRLYGVCEKSRDLIRTVDGVSIVGCAVQAWLNGPVLEEPSILHAMVRKNQRALDAAYPSLRKRRVKSTRKEDAVRRAMKKALADGDKAHQSSKISAD